MKSKTSLLNTWMDMGRWGWLSPREGMPEKEWAEQ